MATPRSPTQSAAEAKAYAAESSTATLRLAVIVFGIVVYWVAYYPRGLPWLALTITVVSMAYALFDVLAKPYKRFPILATSVWTAVTDGLLITLWLHATGDATSPFFPLWYVSIVGVAFRYNWRATILAGVLYVAADTLLVAATGASRDDWVSVVLRDGYLLLLATLAAVLASATTQVFQERFHLVRQVEEAARFRSLAEATPEAIVVTRGGVVLEANRAFCEMVGRPREALLGTSAVAFADPDSVPAIQDRIVHPSDEPLDIWMRDLGRGRRLLRMQARDYVWDGVPARVVSLRDITKEREGDLARQQARETALEVQRLREVDRFKGEFINAAAHELNTPLTPLKLELHVLRQRMADAPEEQRRSLELLDRNVGRLSALVQDMLDVARLESGRLRLDPKPCDLARLARDTFETFASTAQHRSLALSCDAGAPLPVVADAKRVIQILDNLVSNALKFTPGGGHVRIAARAEADGQARVDVTDDGIGLSADQAARLFHPFVQLHRDVVMAPGTGLGLYISRGIAERHGGTLEVSSPGPGKGCTFTLRLPAEGPPMLDPTEPARRPA